MDIRITSEDLIITANPPIGQLQLGYPLSGIYAGIFCQKDSAGTITPLGGGTAIPLSNSFVATDGQQIFTTSFVASTASKIYMNGARVSNADWTFPAGVPTSNTPIAEGTPVIIDQW